MGAIRQNRDVLKTATPEMVRYASPVMHMRRTAMEDTVIGGPAYREGRQGGPWYYLRQSRRGRVSRRDRFLVTRKGAQHVGFGSGQHVCVGSRLAEMQLRVAFDLLADRVTSFDVQAPPRRFRSNFINGLKNLDVIMRAV